MRHSKERLSMAAVGAYIFTFAAIFLHRAIRSAWLSRREYTDSLIVNFIDRCLISDENLPRFLDAPALSPMASLSSLMTFEWTTNAIACCPGKDARSILKVIDASMAGFYAVMDHSNNRELPRDHAFVALLTEARKIARLAKPGSADIHQSATPEASTQLADLQALAQASQKKLPRTVLSAASVEGFTISDDSDFEG